MKVCHMNITPCAGKPVIVCLEIALDTRMNDQHYELESVYGPLVTSRLHPVGTSSNREYLYHICHNP
jgi:hypothetical protein